MRRCGGGADIKGGYTAGGTASSRSLQSGTVEFGSPGGGETISSLIGALDDEGNRPFSGAVACKSAGKASASNDETRRLEDAAASGMLASASGTRLRTGTCVCSIPPAEGGRPMGVVPG